MIYLVQTKRAGVTLSFSPEFMCKIRGLTKSMNRGTMVWTGKPDFGAPNCPVRALRYYHRYMTEHSELGRSDAACLFHYSTTMRGRSQVQPLSLIGSAPL